MDLQSSYRIAVGGKKVLYIDMSYLRLIISNRKSPNPFARAFLVITINILRVCSWEMLVGFDDLIR